MLRKGLPKRLFAETNKNDFNIEYDLQTRCFVLTVSGKRGYKVYFFCRFLPCFGPSMLGPLTRSKTVRPLFFRTRRLHVLKTNSRKPATIASKTFFHSRRAWSTSAAQYDSFLRFGRFLVYFLGCSITASASQKHLQRHFWLPATVACDI